MKTTINCPRPDELQDLLGGALTDERQEQYTEHLEHCSGCQAKLEAIATGGSNLSSLVERLSDVEPVATSAYWPALKALGGDARPTIALRGTRRPRDTALNFLQPATDAAYLGRLAHFDVMRVLGRGGMGVVLEAFDSKLQRHVAIKVLDTELDDDTVGRQRFCREARAAASVTHENIVTVYQVERICEDGVPYIVMQLVPGDTLEQRLARQKPLSLQELVRIGMQSARGLAAAHAQGLIHRDVKPGNILLEPPSDRVKLTDFGLARVTEDVKLTRTGLVSGTPLYMSPEQAMGEEADARSDLFSLGAVLYEAATGQTPFSANSALAILKQIVEVKHRPVHELNPEIPQWMSDLIDELLSKKPEDRYQTATDLAEVLEYHWAHLTNKSLDLPAVCQVEVRRRSMRHRLTLGIAGAAILTLGLLGGMLLPRGPSSPSAASPVSSADPIAVLSANAGTAWSISFDKASGTLAMGVEDGTVRLWDLTTSSVQSTLDAHRGVVWSSRFSQDGKLLATAGDDGLLKLWSPPETTPLRVFQHPNAVRGLAMSADGQRLYAGDRSGGLRVWSATSDEPLVETEQPGAVYAVALSPDGKTLATAGSDHTVRLWNAETLAQKLPLEGHTGPVYGLSFNHDGSRLASVGWDKKVRIWDASSGLLAKAWDGDTGDIWAVCFSPAGDRLATAGQDGAVKLWNADSGELLDTFLGHNAAIHAVAFNADGSRLASAGRDGAVRVWPVE